MTSDHGMPDKSLRIHGRHDKGNEPWLVIYGSELVGSVAADQAKWIDTVDIAATISELFPTVNIPFER